jgi:hypothetical protein
VTHPTLVKSIESQLKKENALRIIREFVSGENDHLSGYPMDNRGFALLMAMIVIATSAFGIIMHGAAI